MDGNKTKSKTAECVSLHIPTDWKQKLVKISFDQDRSINYLMKKALIMWFDKEHGIKVKS